ncbi:hypothetical protein [Burkholderia ubonensis]|uniref:hypothetical protein n=1 Tax=Burkholderia ubonensis TaxID=101571 RepID=UPI00075989D5|nr:hypothetical protein [Burkholderia ubonensis]KWN75055.1 hypothetical protein WM23_26905 [Burkholderia ubonensis]
MIHILIRLLAKLAAVIEAAAEREQQKCELALKQAAALVSKANGHRNVTRQGRQVAAALKEVVRGPSPVIPGGNEVDPSTVPQQPAQ